MKKHWLDATLNRVGQVTRATKPDEIFQLTGHACWTGSESVCEYNAQHVL